MSVRVEGRDMQFGVENFNFGIRLDIACGDFSFTGSGDIYSLRSVAVDFEDYVFEVLTEVMA